MVSPATVMISAMILSGDTRQPMSESHLSNDDDMNYVP